MDDDNKRFIPLEGRNSINRAIDDAEGVTVVTTGSIEACAGDDLPTECAVQEIPERLGLLMNRAYVEQYPHEQRLKMWEAEYYAARRVMDRNGKQSTHEEYNRMTFAAMMWAWERHCGAEVPASIARNQHQCETRSYCGEKNV